MLYVFLLINPTKSGNFASFGSCCRMSIWCGKKKFNVFHVSPEGREKNNLLKRFFFLPVQLLWPYLQCQTPRQTAHFTRQYSSSNKQLSHGVRGKKTSLHYQNNSSSSSQHHQI